MINYLSFKRWALSSLCLRGNNLEKFKSLLDPKGFHDPIDISGHSETLVQKLLSELLQIRHVERTLASKRQEKKIGGPVHLGVGQEAIAVGIAQSLTKTDRVFGAHRSHSHLLSLGSDIRKLFAEVLGKDTGHSKGMGGSMHLWDQPNGFYGSVPIVSGTVPLAVGAGLASKLQNKKDIAVAYLGDGAVEEGVVHESLNLARVQNIPILFVVENNLFSSHMHISLRQPKEFTARFAEANDIPYEVIDGNDVLTVASTSKKMIESIRAGNGPGFIEAVTYRWYGHVDWREDIDVGVNRSKEDLENWRARDPVKRLVQSMMKKDIITQEGFNNIESEIIEDCNSAWAQAEKDPYPNKEALLQRVYQDG